MNNWERTLLPIDATIRETMNSMGKSREHILLVTDSERHLLGTVTDGDIRRSLLRGLSLDNPISDSMNTSPVITNEGTTASAQLALMRKNSIFHLPVVDDDNRVIGLVGIGDLIELPGPRDNIVIVLAGGLGTRLRPMTDETPKPLLPIGGRPILETIIDQLASQGFSRICLSVNYKSEMVRDHFGDGSGFDVDISYLEEESRMGTAGPLSLIDSPSEKPIIVMNGDLLTKLNFNALLTYHEENSSDITVCVREFDMQIPFGVVEFEGSHIHGIVEKPVHQFLVNAGIYVIEPEILKHVPEQRYFDMPDLIRSVIAERGSVLAFPVHEYWLDIGRIEDMGRAASEFSSVFS